MTGVGDFRRWDWCGNGFVPASVPGLLIRPERGPGQCRRLPAPPYQTAVPVSYSIKSLLFYYYVILDCKRSALSKIGFGPPCVRLVIAMAAERGQNSLVTIAAGRCGRRVRRVGACVCPCFYWLWVGSWPCWALAPAPSVLQSMRSPPLVTPSSLRAPPHSPAVCC